MSPLSGLGWFYCVTSDRELALTATRFHPFGARLLYATLAGLVMFLGRFYPGWRCADPGLLDTTALRLEGELRAREYPAQPWDSGGQDCVAPEGSDRVGEVRSSWL